jgi:hypothetical protein
MKIFRSVALVLFAVCVANAQIVDKRVDDIRDLYDQTEQRIADAAKQEQSDIFVVETNVNSRLNPYPAVGIYAASTKFYYTYGDREKDPYPKRLLRADVVVKRSATTTNAEFLYNAAGELVMGIVLTDGDEQREMVVYFSRGQLIKMIDDDKEVNIKLRAVIDTAQTLKAESARLKTLFASAIKEGL